MTHFDADAILRRIFAALPNGDTLTSDNVTRLLLHGRMVIEQKEIKDDYMALSLYANWTHHAKINQNYSWKTLEALHEAVAQHLAGVESDGNYDAIYDAIGLRALRENLRRLCKARNYDHFLVEDGDMWQAFATILMMILDGRPLTLPTGDEFLKSNKAKDAVERMRKRNRELGVRDDLTAWALYFDTKGLSESEPCVCWNLRLTENVEPGVLLRGPMRI